MLLHWRTLRQARVFYARNIDMLIIAVLARALTASRGAVVYEVLDIQRIFLGDGRVNRAVRWVKGASQAGAAPCRQFAGLHEPLFRARTGLCRRVASPWKTRCRRAPGCRKRCAARMRRNQLPPWIIGWFGVLRCARSLDILALIAERLGDKVAIHLRGMASEDDLPLAEIDARCAERPNTELSRPLPQSGRSASHLWRRALRLVHRLSRRRHQFGLASPNRLYEAGLFGVPALTREGTATARKAEGEHLGWSFAEPLEHSVTQFLATLETGAYDDDMRQSVSSRRPISVRRYGRYARQMLLRIDALTAGTTTSTAGA